MIRSAQVAFGTATHDTGVVLYTVPDGYVFLLKSIVYETRSASSPTVQFFLNGAGGFAMHIVNNTTSPVNVPVIWEGWVVLNAGEFLSLFSATADCDYWVSGAVLPYNPAV